MKSIPALIASALLLAAPPTVTSTSVQAFPAGHGGGGGGFHGGGGGGGFRSGGFHGGYGGRSGWRGGYGGYWGAGALGLGLGALYADSWAYGDEGDYGYGPDIYDADPGAYPAQAQAQQQPACGSWVWDATQGKYNWIPCR